MVRRLLCVLLLVAAPVVDAETLQLQLRSQQGEWGKPLRGHLVYQGDAGQLSVDYTPWLPWVAVDPDYQEQGEDAQGRPIIRQALRLYPRRVGHWQLPSLQVGTADSSPLWLDIAAPVFDGHAIQVERTYPRGQLWTREARRLSLRVVTRDPEARVLADLPTSDRRQAVFTPLSSRREVIRDGEGERYAFHWSWWVQANVAGRLQIEPPLLRYRKYGRDVRRFYLPLLELEVQPVPEYITPTTPVGLPTLSSRIVDDAGGAAWQITLTSPAPLPAGLPWLERQLAALSSGWRAVGHTANSIIYRVALPRWQLPGLSTASLQLRYFDPQHGRLQQVDHVLPQAWRWPWWVSVGGLLMLAALAWLPLHRVAAWLRRRRRRHDLAQAIAACETPQQLRRLLLDASRQQTLEAWVGTGAWGAARAEASELVKCLNAACFAAAEAIICDFPDLRQLGQRVARRAPL